MAFFRARSRRAADGARAEEMRAHIELYIDEAMARGLTEDEARREARLRFGNPRVKREEVDALNRIPVLESLGHDLRTAVRSLRAAPGFTATVLLVLTLATGAATAVFSIVDAAVIRPMPFERADRIVALGRAFQGHPTTFPMGGPQLLALEAQAGLFDSLTAAADGNVTVRADGGSEAEILRGQRVTADFFSVLGVSPVLGHSFGPANEVEGRDRVVVISASLWKRRFNGDPNVVGRRLAGVDGDWQVIGVMPAGFSYPVGLVRPTELWRPYVVPADERAGPSHSAYLHGIARLKDGATLDSTQAQLDAVVASMTGDRGGGIFHSPVLLSRLQDSVTGRSRDWALLVLAAAVCVMLIACVNIANLMLVRATVRVREIGVRAALGASRWQLFRMLLAESLVLSIVGTALGLFAAWWAVDALRPLLPAALPRVATVAVNMRVFVAAAVVSVFTGFLFGLVPVFRASHGLDAVLKQEARGATVSGRRQSARSIFLVTQVALAVLLVSGAVLFLTSFGRLTRLDLGLDYRDVLTLTIDVRPSVTTHQRLSQVIDRIRALPNVEAVSLASSNIPFSLSSSVRTRLAPDGRTLVPSQMTPVSSQYFQSLKMVFRSGRAFSDEEERDGSRVVILNERAAQEYLSGRSPIGQSVDLDGTRTVVGVVQDARTWAPERAPDSAAFLPLTKDDDTSGGTLLVRMRKGATSAASDIKAVVLAEFPDVVLPAPRPLAASFDGLIAQPRLNTLLLGVFGLLGIAIACVGIFGVMSYTVVQRTREIGVRIALGAYAGSIWWAVLRRACVQVAMGLGMGLGLAWVLAKSVQSFLFDVQPHEAGLYAIVVAILAATAIIAALVPARRATRVDPVVALRME